MPSSTSFFPILCTLFTAISGLAIGNTSIETTDLAIQARGSGEHVLLSNCVLNGASFSDVAYYGGAPSGAPGASVVSSDTSHGTTWWEGAQQSVTFADGNVFSWYIPSQVAVGTYAGTGHNAFGSFWCYNKWNEFQYSPMAGASCTVLYDCNHNAPVSNVPGDSTTIYYDISSNYVDLPYTFTTSTWNILNHAFEKFDPKSGETVSDEAVDLGNGVSISFTGHGNIAGTTLFGLATVLRQVVSAQKGLTQSWPSRVETSCKIHCEHGICCEWNYQDVTVWKMAQTVTVYARNSATNSDQGSLTYTLTYTPPKTDCTLMNIFSSALGIASLIPDVGIIFGAMGSGVGIVEKMSGC